MKKFANSMPPNIRGKYKEHYPLAKLTWFKTGGAADIVFYPYDLDDLKYFLQAKPQTLKYITLGAGSNTLVRDGGWPGAVIKLGKNFSLMDYDGQYLSVGCGALNHNIMQFCLQNSLTGLEFLAGIPGSIGGAITMNAGAHEKDISKVFIDVDALDKHGNIHKFTLSDMLFKYRGNGLDPSLIFVRTRLRAERAEQKIIADKINSYNQYRIDHHPAGRTSGCTFTNPTDCSAWKLINQCGLKGLRIGGAHISDKHCNFIINDNNATAKDIETIIEKVRDKVKKHTGYELNLEIKIIGCEN